MGARGIIRDIIGIYAGFVLLSYASLGNEISKGAAFWLGLFFLVFSVWFLLERIGVIPKL